jgi:hypothetical protein
MRLVYHVSRCERCYMDVLVPTPPGYVVPDSILCEGCLKAMSAGAPLELTAWELTADDRELLKGLRISAN